MSENTSTKEITNFTAPFFLFGYAVIFSSSDMESGPGGSLLPNQMIFVIAHWLLSIGVDLFHNPDDREI